MRTLRQTLLERGLVVDDDLVALEKWVPYRGASLAERLYRSGLVSDAQLVDAFVALGATDGTAELLRAAPPPAALGALSKAVAERHRALPLRVERARLVVAMLDPADTDGIERLAFYCGLAVEPRAVRPRVLFENLKRAYGIALIAPDAAFMATRRSTSASSSTKAMSAMAGPFDDDPITASFAAGGGDKLPAPSPNTPVRYFGPPTPPGDPRRSPLARSVVAATAPNERVDDVTALEAADPSIAVALQPRHSRANPSVFQRATPVSAQQAQAAAAAALDAQLRDTRPASSPQLVVDERALEEIRRSLPPGTPLEARDSLPPQVLRLLVPAFRAAALFLVRNTVAVGWDARTAGDDDAAPSSTSRTLIRDVLLPLTAPSAFERAKFTLRVALSRADDPSTVERIFWRHLKLPAPTVFALVPILVGTAPVALLYVDRASGALDDALVDAARRVGNTLADGLAPFVAAGTLFPPVSAELRPIPPA